MKIRLFFVLLTVCLSNAATCQTNKVILTETEKIEALIVSVENFKDAKFYRNGSLYSAKDAAEHLRMKVNAAGSKVKTARDFIEKIGSKSSMTGEAYKIVFSNGKELTTAIYFNNVLKMLN